MKIKVITSYPNCLQNDLEFFFNTEGVCAEDIYKIIQTEIKDDSGYSLIVTTIFYDL